MYLSSTSICENRRPLMRVKTSPCPLRSNSSRLLSVPGLVEVSIAGRVKGIIQRDHVTQENNKCLNILTNSDGKYIIDK